MSAPVEQSDVIRAVVELLDRMQLPYAIGGSIASSTFAAHFGPDFYVSVPAMKQANERRSSFNLLHFPSGFKLDFFVLKELPFARLVMQRRRVERLAQFGGQPLYLVSPEDIVLLKLEWYRLGNEVSDRQWSDVLGVLKMQRGKLDAEYLTQSARFLGLSDLLERATKEVAS